MKFLLIVFIFFTVLPTLANTEKFLKAIAWTESLDGKNINHPIIRKGIHKGDRAIGKYALMPNTIQEFINRKKYKFTIEQVKKNKKKQYLIAKDIAKYILHRNKWNYQKSAYAWIYGHNLRYNQIKNPMKSKYVRRFNNFFRSL